MNYLAHLFLSGPDHEIMTGNFIGDHVKGKHYDGYSAGIIKGIELHRSIDAFTDTHAVVEKSKARLRPVFHKYAPVIIDVFYDHFLAVGWDRFSTMPLYAYTQFAYGVMLERQALLPARAQHMLSYMVPHNWLLHYAEVEGISKSLSGMARRTTFQSGMEKAGEWLQKDYELFKNEFDLFFPDLQEHARNFLSGNH